MRHILVVVVGTVALVAAIALLVRTSPAGGAAGPARVQVVAREFEYRLSRLRVPEGQVIVELANFGEDEHDLAFRRVGGLRTLALPKTLPGQRRTRTIRVSQGRYRLWCRVGDHAVRGMYATLTVTRTR